MPGRSGFASMLASSSRISKAMTNSSGGLLGLESGSTHPDSITNMSKQVIDRGRTNMKFRSPEKWVPYEVSVARKTHLQSQEFSNHAAVNTSAYGSETIEFDPMGRRTVRRWTSPPHDA